SDRGTEFTSKFRGKLHEKLGTKLTFNRTFHPQTNVYHSSIDMKPFEALYRRGCRSPIRWFEASDEKPLGVDLVREDQTKVRGIQTKMLDT
ncbi:hypothetical protein MTR67_034385, partial [Solanum verrucosum]